MRPIAALFVETDGVYFGLEGVDPWDIVRDARKYDGSDPVVAHPPCQRWGRYWGGGPLLARTPKQKTLGDDDGCFASAIASVRRCGGVLEHPEASHAWRVHGLVAPPKFGGWRTAGDWIGWTCCVEQGHYGHPARKATWLYRVGSPSTLPELVWGPSSASMRLDEGFKSNEERRLCREMGTPPLDRLDRAARLGTPAPFRDLLISIARAA